MFLPLRGYLTSTEFVIVFSILGGRVWKGENLNIVRRDKVLIAIHMKNSAFSGLEPLNAQPYCAVQAPVF